MASYIRLASYLLAEELSVDPVGKIHRGLTISGSTFDHHVLVRCFSDELVHAGLGAHTDEINRVASLLAGTRGLGHSYRIEGGKAPHVACEYVPGRSLAQMIEKAMQEGIPLGVDHALSVLQGLAQSIIQLHGKGVNHGILSPHSVWISFEGATQVIDAPFAAVIQNLLPKCPATSAALIRYRRLSPTNHLNQDLYSLGAILYELLTFEKLPSSDQLPTALAQATLKAAQEEAPIPAEIVSLLNRLLNVTKPFENAESFNAELERVLYDGDYSPTTFNMAFFMHTLFREENEQDGQAMKADQGADFTSFAINDLETQTTYEAAGVSELKKHYLKIAIAVGLVLAFMAYLTVTSITQKREAEKAAAQLNALIKQQNIAGVALEKDKWNADQIAQQREFELQVAKDEAAKEEAQRRLEEAKRIQRELAARREAIAKATRDLQRQLDANKKTSRTP